jgi:N-acetylglucosaminyl-diphospho-decaprenol L-rhamnosyltransferase
VDEAPDLSVVVLAWNTRDLTLRGLRAVPAAIAPLSVQTICVDNASADGTAAAVRAALPDVEVIESPKNLGFARGNALALPRLRGRYVCFLNGDAAPLAGALSRVVNYLDQHPKIGIASPRLLHPDGKPQRTSWGYPTPLGAIHDHTPLGWLGIGRKQSEASRSVRHPEEKTGPVDAVAGACLVIRRDLCDRLGGFDPGYRFYCEDVDLCWRARREGYEVYVLANGPAVVHEGGASARQIEGALRLPFLAGLLRFIRRSQPWWQYAWFAPIFKTGVALRASWEVVRAPFYWAVRRARKRPERAARTLDTARARLRFLERDFGRFLRTWPKADVALAGPPAAATSPAGPSEPRPSRP